MSTNNICKAYTMSGKKCKYKCKERGYCNVHNKIYKYDKPDECCICFESSSNIHHPLECSHWVHVKCIKKWGTNSCPLCKVTLNKIKVKKKKENVLTGVVHLTDLEILTIQDFLVAIGYNVDFTQDTQRLQENQNVVHILNI